MQLAGSLSRYRWVILGIVFVAQTSNALASQTLAPLAPLFQPDLRLTNAEVGLFSSAAYGGAWLVLLVAGTLTDRYGVRRLLSIGLLMTGITLLSMSWVATAVQAAAVMFLAGIGRGAVLPGCTKAIVDWFPLRARGTAMGLKQTGVPVAGILTAATLPALGLAIGWRSAISVVGLVIVAGGVASAIFYRNLPQSAPVGRGGESIRSSLGKVIRNRKLWALSAIAVLYTATQTSVVTYLALYLKESALVAQVPDENTRIVAAGGFLALCQAGGVFGRVFWGVISDRVFQGRRTIVLAIIGCMTSTLLFVVSREAELAAPWLLGATAFALGATALGWNGLYHALVVESIGGQRAGTAVGVSMSFTQVGVVGGPPLFGVLVDHLGSYPPAWGILSVLAGIGALASLLNTKREKAIV